MSQYTGASGKNRRKKISQNERLNKIRNSIAQGIRQTKFWSRDHLVSTPDLLESLEECLDLVDEYIYIIRKKEREHQSSDVWMPEQATLEGADT